MIKRPATLLSALSLLLMLFVFTGCNATGSSYKLKGRVIEGSRSMVIVVDKDDQRLQNAGIANVPIDLVIEPRSVNRNFIKDTSTENGDFAIPVKEMGAGFLRYDARVSARALGFISATEYIELPGDDQRVLIMLTTGRDSGSPMRDMREEFSTGR